MQQEQLRVAVVTWRRPLVISSRQGSAAGHSVSRWPAVAAAASAAADAAAVAAGAAIYTNGW